MPLGDKALRKRNQEKDKKAGIIRDTRVLQKNERAKADVLCHFCAQSFKVTVKNVDAHKHAESKHPKATFDECFPSLGEQAEESDDGPVDDDLPESKEGWKCALTGSVMFSDGYKMAPAFGGAVMEVKATDVTIGGSIGPNLVAHHDLEEIKMDNAAFMAAIKALLVDTKKHIRKVGIEQWQQEQGKAEELKEGEVPEEVKNKVKDF